MTEIVPVVKNRVVGKNRSKSITLPPYYRSRIPDSMLENAKCCQVCGWSAFSIVDDGVERIDQYYALVHCILYRIGIWGCIVQGRASMRNNLP